MRVLYVNHTARIGGAERSLLELLAALPQDVERALACPPGALADAVARLGVLHVDVRGMNGGLRAGLRHTPEALRRLIADAVRTRQEATRTRADIVHANSIRAGLAIGLVRAPTVVSLRDCLPSTPLAKLTKAALRSRTDLFLANSRFTAGAFDPRKTAVKVIYPPIDLARFDPERLSKAEARASLGLDADAPVLGVVAQLTPWKAQDDAIRSLVHLRAHFPTAQLLLAGGVVFDHPATRFDNVAYEQELRRLASDPALAGAVHFLGERDDIVSVFCALDVLLCPSWEEPFGRSVMEAMAMGVPVLATNVGGPAEMFEDGTAGHLLPPHSPAVWAEAAKGLLIDPLRSRKMGEVGRGYSAAFSPGNHVKSVLDAYASIAR